MKVKKGTPEIRYLAIQGLEIREAPEGSSSPGGFRGYAAVYGPSSVLLPGKSGPFREFIAPGAFDAAIGEDDVRALINHDPNMVLARSKAGEGTLRLSSDDTGLLAEIDELPDTTYARDLLESLKRGDVDQMSFGFTTVSDEWAKGDDGIDERTVTGARLFDVSPVTFPAYPDTLAEARSIADALTEFRAGKVLSQKNHEAISGVVDALTSILSDAEGPDDGDVLEFNSVEKRDGYTIARLGSLIEDCETYAEWIADDDADVSAMNEIVGLLKAFVLDEVSEDVAGERTVRAAFLTHAERRGEGTSIYWLGCILAGCEDFVAWYADDDKDKAQMAAVIARLEALIAAEAAEDAADDRSAPFELLRLRTTALELGAHVHPNQKEQ